MNDTAGQRPLLYDLRRRLVRSRDSSLCLRSLSLCLRSLSLSLRSLSLSKGVVVDNSETTALSGLAGR